VHELLDAGRELVEVGKGVPVADRIQPVVATLPPILIADLAELT
jgi:hypothetical protein